MKIQNKTYIRIIAVDDPPVLNKDTIPLEFDVTDDFGSLELSGNFLTDVDICTNHIHPNSNVNLVLMKHVVYGDLYNSHYYEIDPSVNLIPRWSGTDSSFNLTRPKENNTPVTFNVKVVSVDGANKFIINDNSNATLHLTTDIEYVFDQSDETNVTHPLEFIVEPSNIVDEAFTKWSEDLIIAYENSNLESKYNDFRLLMQEYRDGILLYELTDEKIWSKAVKDTIGLKTYYLDNKKNYMWDTRVDATVINCLNESIALKVRKKIIRGKLPQPSNSALT